MTALFWFPIGLIVGTLSGLTLRRTVGRLRPDTSLAAFPLVALGFLLRLALSAGLLTVALRRGVAPGLLAFVGLWLARWITIYVTLPRRPLAEPLRR
jgi:hypothetical protein